MKHLLALMALCVAFAAGAQGTSIYEYPWNPDWNNDNFVGSSDLTGFLSAFGSEFGNPPEPCDYDGTPFEEFVFGVMDGSIVLDSMFIEYEIQDVSSYYVVGCPDPITDTLIFANSAMMDNVTFATNTQTSFNIIGDDAYGFYMSFQANFNQQGANYNFHMSADCLYYLGFLADGFFGNNNANTSHTTIPFPENWYLDEEGIHLEGEWDEYEWPYYANYLHILPYWHYAE